MKRIIGYILVGFGILAVVSSLAQLPSQMKAEPAESRPAHIAGGFFFDAVVLLLGFAFLRKPKAEPPKPSF